jgi:hypothetical protein
VLSDDDIAALHKLPSGSNRFIRPTPDRPSRLLWDTWSKDPIKATVLGAMVSVQVRLGRGWPFDGDIIEALAQQRLVRFLHSNSLGVDEVHY